MRSARMAFRWRSSASFAASSASTSASWRSSRATSASSSSTWPCASATFTVIRTTWVRTDVRSVLISASEPFVSASSALRAFWLAARAATLAFCFAIWASSALCLATAADRSSARAGAGGVPTKRPPRAEVSRRQTRMPRPARRRGRVQPRASGVGWRIEWRRHRANDLRHVRGRVRLRSPGETAAPRWAPRRNDYRLDIHDTPRPRRDARWATLSPAASRASPTARRR